MLMVLLPGPTGETNLSPGVARRRPIDRRQADDERDERAGGAEREGHHHDKQPTEQPPPGGVTQPREMEQQTNGYEQKQHR
ncbi:MAG: hypothetical protein ACLP4R_01800 [Solirubrobacteraceae bacterium]